MSRRDPTLSAVMSTLARTRSLATHAMISALILLAGIVISSDDRTVAVTQVTATTSADAPGMIHVAWPVRETDSGHRITWWTGSDTQQSPTGSVVRTADWPRRTESALTLTELATGTYSVLVERTSDRDADPEWTAVGQAVTATVAVGPYRPATACPDTATDNGVTWEVVFCVDITNPSAFGSLDLQLSWVTNGTGGTLSRFGRFYGLANPDYPRPRPDADLDPAETDGVEPWYRARLQLVDYAGLVTSRWWTQPGFTDLDTGATFLDATDYLVPDEDSNGGTPPTFLITLDDAGVVLEGTIFKDVDGVATQLDRRSLFDGGDIASPCVAVFTEVDDDWPWVQDICAFGGIPGDTQEGGFTSLSSSLGPGDWRFRLPEGVYKIRVFDRTSFERGSNVLEMRVRFAAQWYTSESDIAENLDQAETLDTTDGVDRSDLDVTLRDGKNLDVVVTDVPEGFRSSARVVVTDEHGNWFQGAAVFDEDDATWTTAFTGLVEGRRYKVFLYFSGSEGYRWWLVGGGTLDLADGVIPSGEELIEPWQPMPYAVAVVDQFGQPWGDGEACFSLAVPGETGEDAVVASSCTANVDGTRGVVVLQRVLAGSYRVLGWVQDPDTGEQVGEAIDLGTIDVAADQEPGPIQPYASGIADVGLLGDDVTLASPYDEDWTVVVPDPDAEAPTDGGGDGSGEVFRYIVSMHEADGTPVADDEACITIRDDDGEEVATGQCTQTVNGIPGLVFLEDVPAGVWTVDVIRIVGGVPRSAGMSFAVDTSDWSRSEVVPDYGIGIADVTRLASGAALPAGYGTAAAVVLPAP
jgi:hypothetical protein